MRIENIGSSIVVEDLNGIPKYGEIHYSSGRVGYRNYGRALKNGRGLTFMDMMNRKLDEIGEIKPLFS